MNISLGLDSITNTDFFIGSTKYIFLSGMSGMGKSTSLVNIFVEPIRQDNGGPFIDPRGDAADQILRLIPKKRMQGFIWIDPKASLVPPFNPLHFNSLDELELGKESHFAKFKTLAGSARGHTNGIGATAIWILQDHDGTYFLNFWAILSSRLSGQNGFVDAENSVHGYIH